MAAWLFALLPVACTCGIVVRRLSRTLTEAIAYGFVAAVAAIVASGYVASAVHRLHAPAVWLMAATAVLGGTFVLVRATRSSLRPAPTDGASGARARDRWVLVPMIAALVATGAANLAVLLGTAPNGIDGLDYHLARMGYYLQQDSFAPYDANFWGQIVHPLNSTILSVHAYLTGGGSERLASVWQYLSYWAAIAAVFGITEGLTQNRRRALFASLVFGLLTQSLVQSNAAGNDMILAALAAIALFALLAYRRDQRTEHLALAAVSAALGLGTKSSFVIPAALLVVVAAFVAAESAHPRRTAGLLAAFAAAAVASFVVPAGYVATVRRFGSPLGPAEVRARHTFAGRGVRYTAVEGSKNVLRFASDFLSLDGLPRVEIVNRAQRTIRGAVRVATTRAGIDLEQPADIRVPFSYDRIASAHEALAYWGILGTGLIWASVLGALFRRESRMHVLLAAITVAFLVLEAFSGPYDPWRGRFFLIPAAWAAPLAARWLDARGLGRAYLVGLVWIGCVSALTAVAFRSNRPLLGADYHGHDRPSVFALDRIVQMTTNIPSYEEPVRRYEQLVPADAIVAVALTPESPEYLFFGAGLGRTLRPINSFARGLQPVPSDARFLLLSSGVLPPQPGDVGLGADLYLRRLPGPARP